MFTVTIREKDGNQRRLTFDQSEVNIGRTRENDIVFPIRGISKRHAPIVVKDGKFIIVDVKSVNGTYVNGRRLTSPRVIKEHDQVYIGDYILSVEAVEADDDPIAAPKVDPMLSGTSTAGVRPSPALRGQARPGDLEGYFLLIRSTNGAVRGIPLAEGKTRIGRHSTNEIVLTGRGVSRLHAELRRETDHATIIDTGSTNGIKVNGIKTARGVLNLGDQITIGIHSLEVLPLGTTSSSSTGRSPTFSDPHHEDAYDEDARTYDENGADP